MSDLIITARDVKAAGMCIVPGTKMFFKRHGLDFRSFTKNGIAAETLLATNDALALEVVNFVKNRQRENHDGQE